MCNPLACPRRRDHVQYTTSEYAQLHQWCRDHHPAGRAGAAIHTQSAETKAGPDVGMDAVLLAGRWTPSVPRDNETHVLLQSALLESAHMATQASESLSNCLTAYRRHADEGWDPNEDTPKDAEAARRGPATAALVAASAQGVNESLSSRLVSYHQRVDGG